MQHQRISSALYCEIALLVIGSYPQDDSLTNLLLTNIYRDLIELYLQTCFSSFKRIFDFWAIFNDFSDIISRNTINYNICKLFNCRRNYFNYNKFNIIDAILIVNYRMSFSKLILKYLLIERSTYETYLMTKT